MDLVWSCSPVSRACATIRPPPIGMVRGASIRKTPRPDLLRSADRKRFREPAPEFACQTNSGRLFAAKWAPTAVLSSGGTRARTVPQARPSYLCVAAHDPRFRCVVVRDVGKPGISALPRIAAGPQTRRNVRFGSDLIRSPSHRRMSGVCAERSSTGLSTRVENSPRASPGSHVPTSSAMLA